MRLKVLWRMTMVIGLGFLLVVQAPVTTWARPQCRVDPELIVAGETEEVTFTITIPGEERPQDVQVQTEGIRTPEGISLEVTNIKGWDGKSVEMHAKVTAKLGVEGRKLIRVPVTIIWPPEEEQMARCVIEVAAPPTTPPEVPPLQNTWDVLFNGTSLRRVEDPQCVWEIVVKTEIVGKPYEFLRFPNWAAVDKVIRPLGSWFGLLDTPLNFRHSERGAWHNFKDGEFGVFRRLWDASFLGHNASGFVSSHGSFMVNFAKHGKDAERHLSSALVAGITQVDRPETQNPGLVVHNTFFEFSFNKPDLKPVYSLKGEGEGALAKGEANLNMAASVAIQGKAYVGIQFESWVVGDLKYTLQPVIGQSQGVGDPPQLNVDFSASFGLSLGPFNFGAQVTLPIRLSQQYDWSQSLIGRDSSTVHGPQARFQVFNAWKMVAAVEVPEDLGDVGHGDQYSSVDFWATHQITTDAALEEDEETLRRECGDPRPGFELKLLPVRLLPGEFEVEIIDGRKFISVGQITLADGKRFTLKASVPRRVGEQVEWISKQAGR